MQQDIIALYDEYTHAPLPRRVFLKRLTALAGSTAAAYALLPLLENNYLQAAMVADDDARISVAKITYPGPQAPVKAYLAKPKQNQGKLPAVIVIHENRGLNAHIEDIARRLAVAGYLALAPDLLSPLGGTPADEDQARELIGKLDMPTSLANLSAALNELKHHAEANGKVACMGFCWGGGMSNELAVAAPDLNAAIAYYGRQPAAEQVTSIQAPVLLHYAGLDERINAGIPAYENALKAAGKTYQLYQYPGANHAFNNDTNTARYNAEAAQLAWQRSLAFLAQYLTA